MLIDVLNCQKVLPSFLPLWNSHTYANLDMARITLNVSFSNLPKCLLMKKCIIFPITVWKIREFTLTTIICKKLHEIRVSTSKFHCSHFHEMTFKSESKFLDFTHCAYMAIKTALEGGRSVRKKLVIYFDGIFDAY